MRLLVVEDEKSLRDDITKKLSLDGYEAEIGRASCRERV